ncbi:MAG: hypothetical protein JOY71_06070 [Acetobacteraceae bacterium]|nr:hypothetical protein [Acetobacteraceae bacterium]
MPWTAPPLPTGLSNRLALIIAGLRGILAAHMAKDRSAVAVLFLAWARLGRLSSRFQALLAAIRAGRLPPTPSARRQAGDDLELPRPEGLPAPRLPGRFGWLIRLVPGAAVYGTQVQYLLADPEMSALLADVPQAGRILRPLCRMLGIRLGPEPVAKRRGRRASASDTAASSGETDASATRAVRLASSAGSGSVGAGEALPTRGIPPASPTAPGCVFASTGFHFAPQNGGPGLGSWPWPPPASATGLPLADDVGFPKRSGEPNPVGTEAAAPLTEPDPA